MDQKNTFITKSNGESVSFSRDKLAKSLFRAGATQTLVNEIIESIESTLVPNQTTHIIYKKAFSLLRKKRRSYAARYKLKQAIMELGPSGFPFEKYIGELFRLHGFEISVSEIYQGACVSHEIDVIARKGQRLLLMECKFRNNPGYSCNVKVPLYIHSRFNDVVNNLNIRDQKQAECWILTNTRFTGDAIKYAECVGIRLMSWNYPEKNSLKDWIDRTGLHPITSLTSLTIAQKKLLLKEDIVLCKNIYNANELLISMGLKKKKIQQIQAEALALCQNEA